MTVLYDGVLSYVPIRTPTNDEVHNCRRLHLRSIDPWNSLLLSGHFSCMESLTGHIDTESLVD